MSSTPEGSASGGFTAGDSDVGKRVDAVVAERAGAPRSLVQAALADGRVTVGGGGVKASHRLEKGDEVAYRLPPRDSALPAAEDIPIEVRYEDERVLVISKPAGLVTHPAAGHAGGTLVNALLGLGVPLAGEGSQRPGLVHRLDKDTSGLLLVSKDDDALEQLGRALRERRVERRYLALVRGRPATGSGTVDAPLGRHPHRRRLMAVVPGGRPAVTHFRVLGSIPEASLLEVTLETGRTHQIRVHLSYLGHPVLGDRTYGGVSDLSRRLGAGRPFLHAVRLAFPHPDDGRLVEVTDPLPDDLRQVLARADLAPPAQ